jgi:uncharacterized protein
MILPDVNVLVYAFRRDAVHHALCRAWLDRVITGDSQFGMSRLVLAGVVRVSTNPRIFTVPSSAEDAFGFCEDILGQSHCCILEPGERHWGIFERLCFEADIRGSRTTDAWFAALAIESGCEWITFDRDFARFPGLKWRVPAASDS